jgi:hypothetical protein
MKGEKMGTNKNENKKGKKKERREINIPGLIGEPHRRSVLAFLFLAPIKMTALTSVPSLDIFTLFHIML